MGNQLHRARAFVLFESTKGTEEGFREHVLQTLKRFARNTRSGTVATVLVNEDGEVLGIDVHGTPSEEMRAALSDLLDSLQSE